MSSGPGKIERAIAVAFHASSNAIFMTEDLVALAYPEADHQDWHRVAVLRAAAKVARRLGWRSLRRTGGGRRGRRIIYFNPESPRSVMLAELQRTDTLAKQRDLRALLDATAAE